MGLFSSEQRIYVGTTVSRVIDDAHQVSSVMSGTVKSLFSPDADSRHGNDTADYILEDLVAGIGTRAAGFYRYGRDHYLYGLPSGQAVTATVGASLVQDVLDTIEGTPVLLAYSVVSDLNYVHLAWKAIHGYAGYHPGTGELAAKSAALGQTVTLDAVTLVLSTARLNSLPAAALTPWGGAVGYRLDEAMTAIGVEATYSWDAAGLHHVETETVSGDLTVTGFNPLYWYFQAKYTVAGTVKFWEYRHRAGTYPTLDALFDVPPTTTGSYFPFVYFRYAMASMDADTTSAGYVTSKKLVQRLGMDYQQLITGIHANPDIANVEQALLVMAVPANSSHPLEQRYLYDFFDGQFVALGGVVTTLSQSALAASLVYADLIDTALLLQDARFKMTLSSKGLYKRLVTGVIGPVGAHAAGTTTLPFTLAYPEAVGEGTYDVVYDMPSHYYRRQVSATQFEELQLLDLQMKYFVLGEYYTAGNGSTHTDLLIVPLDLAVTADYSLLDRETLYSRSLHYVFNSLVIVDIEWYQQDFFQFLVIAVAVVIAVSTGQAEVLGQVLTAVVAGTLTIEAFIMLVAMQVIKYAVTTLALKLFVKAVGGDAALVLAVILMAYGAYDASTAGSLAAAPMAKNLVMVANGLVRTASASLQDDLADVQSEMATEQRAEQDQWKLLGDAAQLLDSKVHLSPFTFFGESSEHYFNRTVHSGNIGMMGIDAVSNYVERSLSLPTLPTQFGGIAS